MRDGSRRVVDRRLARSGCARHIGLGFVAQRVLRGRCYGSEGDRDDLAPGSRLTPTGAILWVLYVPPYGIAQALGLTRDPLSLIEIFQALAVDCCSKPTVVMEALAWAEDDRLDDVEVVAYVRAGISRSEVDHFERCPEDKPNSGQLSLLAGLRAAR
ncbi:MAG: hypothetical protein NVS3B1_11450 [Marmoricola sp.]